MAEWESVEGRLPINYERLKDTQGRLIICQQTAHNVGILTYEDLNNAIKAISKRIPAKVIRKAGTDNRFCPYCGNIVSSFEKWDNREMMLGMDYCKYCGQNLNWSDDNG